MDDKMRLEMEVSDIILRLIDEDLNEIMPRGDVQGVVEAQTKNIIKMVEDYFEQKVDEDMAKHLKIERVK
jgi:hypothetical protein